MATERRGGGTRPWTVTCVDCGKAERAFAYVCAGCGGPLVVEAGALVSVSPSASAGMGRWRDVLPDVGDEVTLGEGATPLLPWPDEDRSVHLKLESLNPTLSFKDRAMALGAAYARASGARGLTVASTGNAAASASAYAAAAGIACRVVVGSESQAAAKLSACRAYGAVVAEVPGDYSDAYARAMADEADGWLNVSTTYRNPLLAEAYRTIAFELLEQLGRTPGTVVVPVGAGPLLRGIEQGFADAVAVGAADSPPRLIGVQAAAVSPLARAFAAGRTHVVPSDATPGSTLATAIADRLRGYERHGGLTLEAVTRTGGAVVAVTEDEIVRAMRALARAGVWVEPSAATALAALAAVGASDGPVVLMLTGHGAKAPVPEALGG